MGNEQFTSRELARQKPVLKLRGLECELTSMGHRLLEANTTGEIQDVFLRQFIRYEIPSPIEGLFPEGRMKPFIYLLQILTKLREQDKEALTKTETAAFLQLFVDHVEEAVEQTVQHILDFRKKREECESQRAKREFDVSQLQKTAKVGDVGSGILMDYADTTFRYAKMTGLVADRDSRLVLRESKIPIIEAVLANEPMFLAEENPLKYLEDFYSGTSLPTGEIVFALEEIQRLLIELKKYGKKSPSGGRFQPEN
jgi:hypothetical protein